MTNKEAIEIVESMMFNMGAEGIRISRNEDEAIEKLIQTAKDYDALMNMTCVKISKEDEEKIIDKLNEVGNIGICV